MTKLKLLFAGLLCFLQFFSAKGESRLSTPLFKVQFNITSTSPLSAISFYYLQNDHKSDIVFKKGDVFKVNKQLDIPLQIAYFGKTPVFISSAAPVNLKLSTKGKLFDPPGITDLPEFKGPASLKQSIAYQLDTLYQTPNAKLADLDFNALKGHLSRLDKRKTALIKQAGIVKPEELALLSRFVNVLRMRLKYDYLVAACNGKVPSSAFAEWHMNGENFKGTDLEKICNSNLVNIYLIGFNAGLRFHNPSITEMECWEPILREKNQFLIKDFIIPRYFRKIHEAQGLNPDLERLYQPLRNIITSDKLKNDLDEFYSSFYKLKPGNPAPDFTLPDLQGKSVKLSDFKGKMVVIDFWGTWCFVCLEVLPQFKAVADSYKDRSDIVFIKIANDGHISAPVNYLKKHNMEGGINLFMDGGNPSATHVQAISDTYRLKSYPRFIVIDRNGNLLSSNLEFPDKPEFKQKIDQWYKEKR